MQNTRRNQRKAHALLANAETTITRAAERLFAGDPLAAMRLARATEQLLALHARVAAQRAYDARVRLNEAQRALEAARSELEDREGALAVREWRLSQEAARIETVRQQVETLYAELRAAPSADDA